MALGVGVGLLLAGVAGTVAAHPPPDPDHGLNETLFPLLWSGDDDGNISVADDGSDAALAVAQLAQGVDVPFTRPPSAVEDWNTADLSTFPETDADVSIRPAGAPATDGRFVRDAHVTTAAIVPSTLVHVSPDTQPLYVRGDGRVLGVMDFRIELPEDETAGTRRVSWAVESVDVSDTRLAVDGREVSRADGRPTWSLPFEGLAAGPHTLTVSVDIDVTVEKHVRTEERVCRTAANETMCRTVVSHDRTTIRETVGVDDDRRVRVPRFHAEGTIARYPDGNSAVALTNPDPWLGYEIMGNLVTGAWRFYTARDRTWDELAYSRAEGTVHRHSQVHPLQTHVFPSTRGATAPAGTVDAVTTRGESTAPPALADPITLDVPDDSYDLTETVLSRVGSRPTTVESHGLVRGMTETIAVSSFDRVPVHRTNLTATTGPWTNGTVTVSLSLRDDRTGAPIDTSARTGHLEIAGERVDTGPAGTATIVVAAPVGSMTPQFVPGRWPDTEPAYVGDTALVPSVEPSTGPPTAVSQAAVVVGFLLMSALLTDRFTPWDCWPPWRGV